uniref:Uncharacterized protein LOC113787033 n=1 Tax=Cicer arietinum TaxID=3827 RepID=A0A3Q7Y1C3_CICAR|nr:uncharacterized protein LOC113787033 [Cicer arietinum]
MVEVVLLTCLNITKADESQLWHSRYGHLNFKGMKLLHQKGTVKELSKLEESTKVCSGCMVGKQQYNHSLRPVLGEQLINERL